MTEPMTGSEISVGGALTACAARRRAYLCSVSPSGLRGSQKDLDMGIFEPLIDHTHYKALEPWHRHDVVALLLLALLAVWLLAVVLLVWGG